MILETLWQRLPGLMRANLSFWIPAQGFQFSQVAPEDQAMYVAGMSVLWNGVLAAVTAPKVTGGAEKGTENGAEEGTENGAENGAEEGAETAVSNAVAAKVRTVDMPVRSR